MRGTPEQRFWAKVDKTGSGECWHWTGAHTDQGYANFSVHGSSRAAHRWFYEQQFGPVP
jgi:hypothetical protein